MIYNDPFNYIMKLYTAQTYIPEATSEIDDQIKTLANRLV